MTRLDERLNRLEQRLDEIHALMLRLIASQANANRAIFGSGDEPTRKLEPIIEELDSLSLPGDAGVKITWDQDDPLEIQYQLVRNWAAQGRTEDLSDFDLSGRNLRNTDLKDAKLVRANLSRADLTGAKLARADLTNANLSRAQLARVDLTRVTMVEADLTFANLNYAKLEGASLRHAVMTRCNLTGANLSGADLGGAEWSKAVLTRANLKGAEISHRQIAAASSMDGATMPDGRVYDGDPEPYKVR